MSGGRIIALNLALIGAALIVVSSLAAGCGVKLPEEGSPQALLYRERCTECHDIFRPGAMTPKMWETILGGLDGESRRGHPAVPWAERQALLEYIMRHAHRPGASKG